MENVQTTTSDGNILVGIAIFSCQIKIGEESTKILFSKPFILFTLKWPGEVLSGEISLWAL